jgi:virulence factor
MSKLQSVNVGVIGLGSFATVARLPVLAGLPNARMTACMARTSRTVDRIVSQFGFQKGFTELEAFIRESGVEAAVVATPKQTHYDIVMPLLEHGIHVFCEKPMAMSLGQAEQMVQCAAKNGRVLMIGFNRRYAPVYEWAKKEFSEQRPDVCVAFKNRPGTEYRATLENAIHMVDLMRFFCGDCVELTAHAQYTDRDYEDSTAAVMKFDSGAVGFLLGNRTCGQWMERVELYGSGKTVMVNCPDDITVVDNEQEHTRKLTPLHSGWATLEEKMGFRQEMAAFLDAVTGGIEPRTLASDSIKTHILLNRILKASGLPEMEA